MLKGMKEQIKNQRGFTLVELLAVIVILGIIAAIAVPAIGNIIDDSRKDAEINDALQIINAAKLAQVAGDEGTKDSEATDTWKWNKDTDTDTNDLANYLTTESDYISVTYTSGEGFSIQGHAGLKEEFDGDADFSNLADSSVPEDELLSALATE